MLLALRKGEFTVTENLSGSMAYLFSSLPIWLSLRLDFKAGSPGKLATDKQLPGGSTLGVEGGGWGRHRGDQTISMGPLVHNCTIQPARCLLAAREERNTNEQS